MAFASGVQEMLLQSHTGVIQIFPAVPTDWSDIDFEGLRAMGAFLVGVHQRNGEVFHVEVTAEKGGLLRLKNPFKGEYKFVNGDKSLITEKDGVLEIMTEPGEKLQFMCTK